MPVKRKSTVKKRSIRRKKITTQDPRAAAIAEIEAILNSEILDEDKNSKILEKTDNKKQYVDKDNVMASNKKHSTHLKTVENKTTTSNFNINKTQNHNHNVSVLKGSDQSPYLVDLKQIVKQQTEAREMKIHKQSMLSKLLVQDHQSSIMHQLKNTSREVDDYLHHWEYKLSYCYNKYAYIINQLAIVNVVELLFLILKKLLKYPIKGLLIILAWSKHVLRYAIMYIRQADIMNKTFIFFHSLVLNTKKLFYRKKSYFVRHEYETTALDNNDLDELDEENIENKFSMSARLAAVGKKARSIKFLPPLWWHRQLTIFVLIAILFILPLKAAHYFNIFQSVKGAVLGESEAASTSLRDALGSGENMDFIDAANNFARAAESFGSAEKILNNYSSLINLAHIMPSRQTRAAAAGDLLIRSASQATNAGQHFALALNALQLPHLQTEINLSSNNDLSPLTERLGVCADELEQTLVYLQNLSKSLESINIDDVRNLPIGQVDAITEQLAILQDRMPLIISGTQNIIDAVRMAIIFLGDAQDTRYLLIFQNNAEMRASGGFIGSYALVDFRQGDIKNLEVPEGGSYDLQGGLRERISSPQPLHLINSLWEFQDANWWPDWPTSAKKIQWFFENGWGSSVDGVIAIDPTFVEQLLDVIGGVQLSNDGPLITSDNFYDIVQNRDNLADPNKPKAIIKELVEKIVVTLPVIITPDNFVDVMQVVANNLDQKHILFYLNDPTVQNFIAQNGWDGAIKDTNSDYLSVINTNIAGAKTDRKIRQSIKHTADITPDGSIVDTVTIKREHTAVKGEPYAGVRNVNYLRVYVPMGSELISASGFSEPDLIYFDEPAEGAKDDPALALVEQNTKIDPDSGVRIYNEFNKTVFANWTQVDPGQTINIVLKYKLPFKINSIKEQKTLWENLVGKNYILGTYSLMMQKQPGSVSSKFDSTLSLPYNMQLVWHKGLGNFFQSGWQLDDNLTVDKYWGAVIQKNEY